MILRLEERSDALVDFLKVFLDKLFFNIDDIA